MIKNETGGKRITKSAAAKIKTYGSKGQEDYYAIKNSEFIKAKRLRKSASKELTFYVFDKWVHDINL